MTGRILNRRNLVLAAGGAALASTTRIPVGVAAQEEKTAKRPFTIDVHMHFGSDGHSAEHVITPRDDQIAEIYGPFEFYYDENGDRQIRPKGGSSMDDPDALVRFLDDNRVDMGVIFPYSPNRTAKDQAEVRFDSTNQAIADAVSKHPKRLIGMCGHDPFQSLWEAPLELERRVKHDGFKGMKMYPPYYHFDPRDEALYPLYKKASDLGAVLFFHTGWTPLTRAPMKYGHPQQLDEVGIKFPDLKINLAHSGGLSWWRDAVLIAARHPNFTLDMAGWCPHPPQDVVDYLNLARNLVGTHRIMFGSEQSLCPPQTLVQEILNMNKFAEMRGYPPFSDEDFANILGLSAARLFDVKPKYRAPTE